MGEAVPSPLLIHFCLLVMYNYSQGSPLRRKKVLWILCLVLLNKKQTHSPPLDPQSSSRLESSTDPPSREGCICLPLLVPPCLDTRSCRRPRRARDLTAGLLRVSVRGVSACSRHPAHDNRLGRGNHRGVTRADTGVCPYIRAPIIPTAAVLSRGFLHFLHYLHCFLIVLKGSSTVKTG